MTVQVREAAGVLAELPRPLAALEDLCRRSAQGPWFASSAAASPPSRR